MWGTGYGLPALISEPLSWRRPATVRPMPKHPPCPLASDLLPGLMIHQVQRMSSSDSLSPCARQLPRGQEFICSGRLQHARHKGAFSETVPHRLRFGAGDASHSTMMEFIGPEFL